MNNVEIKYEKFSLENYISEILNLGLCKLFLPVNFIREKEEITGIYGIEGYRRLSALKTIGTEDIFNLVISLLYGVENTEKHYIFFEEYDVDEEKIYIDKGFTQTKLVFIPSKTMISGKDKILNLIKSLKAKAHEEGMKYLDDAVNFIMDCEFDYGTIIHHLEELRKEVYLCAIE